MSLKKLGAALLAVMALGTVSASNAFAVDETVTDPASWTTDGGTLVQNTPQAITCSKTASSPNFILHATVGGAPLKLQATGVECSEAAIKNVTVGGVHMATAEGKVTFTGVSVVEPAGCTTPAMIKTNAVKADLLMGKGGAGQPATSKGFVKFEPAVEGGNFTSVVIEGCAAEGKYPVRGFTIGEATTATEVHAQVQEVNGSETTAAMSGLKFGTNAANLTGEIAVELSSATTWGAAPDTSAVDETVTDPASWTTDAPATLAQNTPHGITCAKTAASPNFTLHLTIFGAPMKFSATGIECPGGTIENITVEGVHMAVASGKLKFTGISIVEPAGCTTPATNETATVKADLLMGKGTAGQPATSKGFVKFVPALEGGNFTSLTIEGCAAEGKYPIKGFIISEATTATEVHAVTQEINGSETTAAMSGLKFGTNAASLTGEIAVTLSSPDLNTAWGAEPN
jgi:hypothetical protein